MHVNDIFNINRYFFNEKAIFFNEKLK